MRSQRASLIIVLLVSVMGGSARGDVVPQAEEKKQHAKKAPSPAADERATLEAIRAALLANVDSVGDYTLEVVTYSRRLAKPVRTLDELDQEKDWNMVEERKRYRLGGTEYLEVSYRVLRPIEGPNEIKVLRTRGGGKGAIVVGPPRGASVRRELAQQDVGWVIVSERLTPESIERHRRMGVTLGPGSKAFGRRGPFGKPPQAILLGGLHHGPTEWLSEALAGAPHRFVRDVQLLGHRCSMLEMKVEREMKWRAYDSPRPEVLPEVTEEQRQELGSYERSTRVREHRRAYFDMCCLGVVRGYEVVTEILDEGAGGREPLILRAFVYEARKVGRTWVAFDYRTFSQFSGSVLAETATRRTDYQVGHHRVRRFEHGPPDRKAMTIEVPSRVRVAAIPYRGQHILGEGTSVGPDNFAGWYRDMVGRMIPRGGGTRMLPPVSSVERRAVAPSRAPVWFFIGVLLVPLAIVLLVFGLRRWARS